MGLITHGDFNFLRNSEVVLYNEGVYKSTLYTPDINLLGPKTISLRMDITKPCIVGNGYDNLICTVNTSVLKSQIVDNQQSVVSYLNFSSNGYNTAFHDIDLVSVRTIEISFVDEFQNFVYFVPRMSSELMFTLSLEFKKRLWFSWFIVVCLLRKTFLSSKVRKQAVVSSHDFLKSISVFSCIQIIII